MSEPIINNPRAEIDAIDTEILRLLNKRAEIALRVGAAKTVVDTSLCDPKRESEVLERLTAENPGPFDAKAIENIFRSLLAAGEDAFATRVNAEQAAHLLSTFSEARYNEVARTLRVDSSTSRGSRYS